MSATTRTVTPARLFFALAILAGAATFFWWRIRFDPQVILLLPDGGAGWIKHDEPFWFGLHKYEEQGVAYRTRFVVGERPEQADLTARVLRRAAFYLDGEQIYPSEVDNESWKVPIKVPLARYCTPGEHELVILVFNRTGPCLLLAYCDALGLKTGGHWETSLGDGEWRPAVSVDLVRPNRLALSVPSTPQALKAQLPLLLTVFIFVFGATLAYQRWGATGLASAALPGRAARVVGSVSALRWFLILAWIVLAVNNNWKVRYSIGFDAWSHMLYVGHIYHHGSLPYANDGWQMFQTPLYYALTSLVVAATRSLFGLEMESAFVLSRLICHLCGIGQIELCYRAVRYTFPGRADLQRIGLVVGGLMPMNLYISQFFSNEPLAGLLTACAVVLAIRALRDPSLAESRWWQWGLAILVGLAVLTKVTAVLLIPPLTVAVFVLLSHRYDDYRRIVGRLAQMAVLGSLVCGWYFVRNTIRFGKPFVGGWDPLREYYWWQEPGYRTPQQFFSFGDSLLYAVYPNPTSLLDTIYSTLWVDGFLSAKAGEFSRPPWQYSFLTCSPVLSLLPTIGLLIGVWLAFRHREAATRRILLFGVGCLAIYYAAIVSLYLSLPIFSTAKSTYTIGLLPLYAVLCAAGLGWLGRRALLRALIYGVLACWAVFSYAAYFVTMPQQEYVERNLEYLQDLSIEKPGEEGPTRGLQPWHEPAM